MIIRNLLKKFLTVILLSSPIIISAQNYCDFIEKVQEYQKSIRLNTKTSPVSIDSSTLNIEFYLKFFNKLRTPENTKCDYFFLDAEYAGLPFLYLSQEQFSLKDYLNKQVPKRNYRSEEKEKYLKYKTLNKFIEDSSRRAKFHMIPEDSEEGYFQYLFFYRMGEQFALWSHANYGKMKILCSQEMLDPIMKECSTKGFFKKGADIRSLDLSPKLILEKDYCYITWIEVETHNGVYRRTYKISRNFPFKVTNTEETKLLELIRTISY